MGFLEDLIIYSYHNAQNRQNEEGIRKSALLVASVSIVMSLLTILFLVLAIDPDFGDDFGRVLRGWFGRRSGKLIGYFLVIVIVGACYPVLAFLMNEQRFQSTLAKYRALDESQQQISSQRGMMVLLVPVVLFFIFFFAYGIRIM